MISVAPVISRTALTICTQVVPFIPPNTTYTIISTPTSAIVAPLAKSLVKPNSSATRAPAPTICASR